MFEPCAFHQNFVELRRKRATPLRKIYQRTFKKFFYDDLIKTREKLKYTPAQMATLLIMDDRSYADLDHGNSCCSALTLVLYLIYCCDDPMAFLENLSKILEVLEDDAAQKS